MRIFIAALVFIFSLQSWTKADDIRDFEIEGMSIGDSLLDHFSEEEILSKKKNWFKSNKFSVAAGMVLPSFEIYDSVQIGYKIKDKKFLIGGLEGYIFFSGDNKNIKNCYKKQNEIIDEISNLFPNAKKGEKKTFKHPAPDNENMITNISFYFDHSDIYGDKVMLACTDRKDVDYNNLIVILRSESYSKFLKYEAY